MNWPEFHFCYDDVDEPMSMQAEHRTNSAIHSSYGLALSSSLSGVVYQQQLSHNQYKRRSEQIIYDITTGVTDQQASTNKTINLPIEWVTILQYATYIVPSTSMYLPQSIPLLLHVNRPTSHLKIFEQDMLV
jgi:hypothetical protein